MASIKNLNKDETGGYAATQMQPDEDWQATRMQLPDEPAIARMKKRGDSKIFKVLVESSKKGVSVRRTDGNFTDYRWKNIEFHGQAGRGGILELPGELLIEIADSKEFARIISPAGERRETNPLWIGLGIVVVLAAAATYFFLS
jgi:hypothetical protein